MELDSAVQPAGALERTAQQHQPVERERAAPAQPSVVAGRFALGAGDQLESLDRIGDEPEPGQAEIRVAALGQLDPRVPVAVRLEVDALFADVGRDLEVVDLALLFAGGDVLAERAAVAQGEVQGVARAGDHQPVDGRRHRLVGVVARLAGAPAVRAQPAPVEPHRADLEVGMESQLDGDAAAHRARGVDSLQRQLGFGRERMRGGIEAHVELVGDRPHHRSPAGAADGEDAGQAGEVATVEHGGGG